ncbi:hypothetical protein VT85_23455 [Planctomyces sp. SH-PL62]|nr:hypothetical protein VT85_23455 [Planctomyces sp. SH-PL62]
MGFSAGWFARRSAGLDSRRLRLRSRFGRRGRLGRSPGGPRRGVFRDRDGRGPGRRSRGPGAFAIAEGRTRGAVGSLFYPTTTPSGQDAGRPGRGRRPRRGLGVRSGSRDLLGVCAGSSGEGECGRPPPLGCLEGVKGWSSPGEEAEAAARCNSPALVLVERSVGGAPVCGRPAGGRDGASVRSGGRRQGPRDRVPDARGAVREGGGRRGGGALWRPYGYRPGPRDGLIAGPGFKRLPPLRSATRARRI